VGLHKQHELGKSTRDFVESLPAYVMLTGFVRASHQDPPLCPDGPKAEAINQLVNESTSTKKLKCGKGYWDAANLFLNGHMKRIILPSRPADRL
jgi:hypothetical protein